MVDITESVVAALIIFQDNPIINNIKTKDFKTVFFSWGMSQGSFVLTSELFRNDKYFHQIRYLCKFPLAIIISTENKL